jgi:4-hydroxybenzoate polyprenyltransferase
MALVFTAIADGWCGLALWEAWRRPGGRFMDLFDPWRALLMAIISVGLYGFGMSLNDIIDRRRDRQISPGRPLPSGRVSLATAHVICFGLLAVAVVGGMLFRLWGGADLCLQMVGLTLLFIWFYDAAGKYLVGPGLVTLGLVRFCQSMIPALQSIPQDDWGATHPLIWHPLWLLNHVAILSTVCYAWEEKRPPLNARHWIGVILTLLAIDAAVIWWTGTRIPGMDLRVALRLDERLIAPAGATLAFILLAWTIKRRSSSQREAGQATMLYGLLWLIVYDAIFAGLWAHWASGVAILMLLPAAYFSVQVMRGWSRLLAASQRPDFKRAGT